MPAWGEVAVNGLDEFFSFDVFFSQSERLAQAFPREVMLTEGSILGATGGAFVLFLLIAMLRRNAVSAVAASVAGMTFLIESLAFGRLATLPDSSGQVIFALFLASLVLFLTASVRAARENMVIGAVLLGLIVLPLALGATGYLGLIDADLPLRLLAITIAIVGTALCVHQALAGDNRSAMIAPGVGLAAVSPVAFFIAQLSGVNNWISFAIPHVMLSAGIVLAGLMVMLPGFPAGSGGKKKAARAPAAPMMMKSDKKTRNRKQRKTEPALDTAFTDLKAAGDDEADVLIEPVLESDPAPVERAAPVRSAPPMRAEAPAPAPAPAPARESGAAQSPISALWGHKHPNVRQEPVSAQRSPVTDLRSALGAEGHELWDWTSPGQINASEETAALFGVSKISALTPETVRGLICDADLATYDDEILGGGDPQSGRFSFVAGLRSGRRLSFKGERRVDADGFVERIITFVSPYRAEPAPARAPVRDAAPAPAPRPKPPSFIPSPRHQAAAPADAPAAPAERVDPAEIRAGLAAGEFEVWFQPVVRLATEQIAGFEALLRWRRQGRPVSPDAFMSSAIDAGLEMDILAVTISQAAAELAAWIRSSPGHGQFVSVNVSAQTMLNDRIVKLVRQQVRDHNLPDGALVIELTESHVLGDAGKVLAIAKALRQAGARIALDDLGAGQSTLDRLSRFRFDIIKTDKGLLSSAERDQHGHTLLAGIVDMAHRMGTQVIAEGIESAETAHMLRSMNCDFAQGFHYGRPEPAGGGAFAEEEGQPVTADLR